VMGMGMEQDEMVEEKVTALLPSTVLSGLTDSNWKTRLSAVEEMTEVCLMFLWLPPFLADPPM